MSDRQRDAESAQTHTEIALDLNALVDELMLNLDLRALDNSRGFTLEQVVPDQLWPVAELAGIRDLTLTSFIDRVWARMAEHNYELAQRMDVATAVMRSPALRELPVESRALSVDSLLAVRAARVAPLTRDAHDFLARVSAVFLLGLGFLTQVEQAPHS